MFLKNFIKNYTFKPSRFTYFVKCYPDIVPIQCDELAFLFYIMDTITRYGCENSDIIIYILTFSFNKYIYLISSVSINELL